MSKLLDKVLIDIANERNRQEVLKAQGKFEWSVADEFCTRSEAERTELTNQGTLYWPERRVITPFERLTVLAEEFGEVSAEVCEGITRPLNRVALRSELIQVAAVCAAWVEYLDKTE